MRSNPGCLPVRGALFALAMSVVLAWLAPAPAVAGDLLDQYCATDRLHDGQPRSPVVTPDGREVLFLRSGPRDRDGNLWALDTRTGAERLVLTASALLAGADETLSPEELARRERLRLSARGIASFELSPDGTRLLVPISGRLFLCARATGHVTALSHGDAPCEDARFSPDGTHVAFVRAGDLWVIDVASRAEARLTTHAGERTGWGLPEFVAQEELDRFEGYWWSPDSRSLLVQYTDETEVERLSIADPAHPETPAQEWAYPRAGRANADVRLAFVPATGGTPRWVRWDRTRWPYLGSAGWPVHGAPLLQVMDRAEQSLAVLAADTATGATRELIVEHDSAFVDLHPGAPRMLADGRRWLWIGERDDSGPWLERRDGDAAAGLRLTPPGLRVQELLTVDDARGAAYVLASDDPCETHVWRVPLSGGAPVRLGRDSGVEGAAFARGSALHVRTLRPAQGTPRWLVENGEGRVLAELRSVAEVPVEAPRVEWTVAGADSLHACLVRPHDFDPGRRYPVIDYAYGGPHYVQASRAAAAYVIPQWLADQGFVVVSIDGRGTPGRGRSWIRAIRGDLAGPALADHVEGLRALCGRYPELDADRIGVTGWSFGGYFTLMALERAGETYKAGVAIAPVVDWRDYDTAYTERYLGQPQADSLAYARSSALTLAPALARPLLVIHGTADDNVYFFHSLNLARVLNRAGRDWSFLPMPGQAHGVGDPEMLKQVYQRTAGLFRRELGVPGDAAPPRR